MQNTTYPTIKAGDIVEHSGGYNCTQTQFYRVEGFNKSGKKASLRRLGTKQIDGDWMNGNVGPTDAASGEAFEVMVKADYKGEPMLRGRAPYGNGQKGPIENFYKWSGKPIWNNCD